PSGDEYKCDLLGGVPKHEIRREHDDALKLVKRIHCRTAVEHPDWDQVEEIEPRAGMGKRSPHGNTSLLKDREAYSRCDRACQWSCQADLGTCFQRDAQSAPAHIGSESR